jgi:hypothetical protein
VSYCIYENKYSVSIKDRYFLVSAGKLSASERKLAPWNKVPHFYVKMKLGFRSDKGYIREESAKNKDRHREKEIHFHLLNGRTDYRREK